MQKLFLDPNQPLHTCIEKSCSNCDVSNDLNCHFHLGQLIRFLICAFPPFIIAGIGIYLFNPVLLLPWIIMIISYFGFIEIRVMCSHCPHYAEPEIRTLKCWANYGSPKLWRYHPGPMSLIEKFIFFLGLILIIIYPYIFLFLSRNFITLILYSITVFISLWALNNFLCVQCINFACPFNRVKNNIREKFFNKNPRVGDAWQKIRHTIQ